MGFLDSGAGADLSQVDDSGAPEPANEQVDNSIPVETQPEPKGERVALPTGRRAAAKQAQDAVLKEIGSLKETLTQEQQRFRQELERRDRELAELRGGFQAIQPILQKQQETAKPQAPNPDDLHRKATEALEAGRFEEYRRYEREAITAEVLGKIPQSQAQQQPQGPMLPPELQMVIMTNPAAQRVVSNKNGLEMFATKDNELRLMGISPGPERWRKAFELADNTFGGSQAVQPQYSQQSAHALAAVPTSRPSAPAAREPGITLTKQEEYWADLAGMSREEYAKFLAESNPSRIENG
jgi:hypothetical protein